MMTLNGYVKLYSIADKEVAIQITQVFGKNEQKIYFKFKKVGRIQKEKNIYLLYDWQKWRHYFCGWH